MQDQIANRYTNAFVNSMSTTNLAILQKVFFSIGNILEDDKVKSIFFSPYLSNKVRQDILLQAVEFAKNSQINNIIRLLVQKRRLDIFKAIAINLALLVAKNSRNYYGKVFSNEDISSDTLKEFSRNIGKKMNVNISLTLVKNDYDGVKITIDDLGIEISLCKSNIRNQMIDYILKSI